MSEPTMKDMTQAAAFISQHCQPAFSPVEATHALSWMIAGIRQAERDALTKRSADSEGHSPQGKSR